jgi:endogenous inhibitor of DNA gyrase (YacG/DUF329 family)
MRDPDLVPSCPTCGLPTSVFLLTTQTVRCPECRMAWEATVEPRVDRRDGDSPDHRTIDDLI